MRRLMIRHRIALLFLLFCSPVVRELPAQTVNISGAVSSQAAPVGYALLVFVDQSDTTKQFSAVTDTLGLYRIGPITSVHQSGQLPRDFELAQNYPNPFAATTAIPYELAAQSQVQVTIYDILGREVKAFHVGSQAAGVHRVLWDGKNASGKRVTAGTYFYRLQVGSESQVRKMLFGIGGPNHASGLPPALFSDIHGVASTSSVNGAAHNSSVNGVAHNSSAYGVANKSSLHGAAHRSSVHGAAHTAGKFVQVRNYTVRVANTDSTSPLIEPAWLGQVSIDRDTTLDFAVDEYAGTAAVRVNLDSTKQVIRGFGAANILPWRPDMTSDQITRAFGTGPGQAGMSILRFRVPPDTLEFRRNIQTAVAAKGMGVTLIASPWSPPARMKSNNNIVGGILNDTSYASYAAHLKSFADFMVANGAPLHAISVQNEPDVTVTYESCDWNPTQVLRFVRDFAPAVGTPIIAPESFNFNHAMSDPILNDPVAVDNVSIIGGHIYGGGLGPYPLAASKGKEFWMTEHLVLDTTWSQVLATGKEINDCMRSGMHAYIWWYIVRYYGPILENGNVSKRGYVMSQFARFVRPGFVRVKATEAPQRNVEVTAYRDGAKVVIVALNRSSAPIEQTFYFPSTSAVSFTPYVTSSSKNCVEEAGIPFMNNRMSVTLEASSITTLVGE